MSDGFDVNHEPSDEAGRIWRAIKMVHDRTTANEAELERRREALPRLIADAMTLAITDVISDPNRRAEFWQGGVNHIRTTWLTEAGRSVTGMLWGAAKVAGLLALVLVAFGPTGFKALLASWLGMDVK